MMLSFSKLIKHKTARSLRLSAFAALFFSVIAVGCTDSEANETERIMAELETQMQVAEQEVAEAVQEYRENSGDMKDDVPFREQLELDSMDFLDIVMELRKRHRIQIPEEDYGNLASMESTVKYLEPLMKDM